MVELEINGNYRIADIEKAFQTDFGHTPKGINLRTTAEGGAYIIILSREKGPYSDEYSGNILHYDGEGLNRDQTLTHANKALAESNETGRIIYGFRQTLEDRKTRVWTYLGVLKVLGHKYVEKDGYKKYEFELKVLD
jgi:putative restriction endonuclease